ncbi:hypothetical protein, conserved [Eimeria praecox]|uniref:Uncharacterized protein n=1 Tax=Eimeria praecox TaxID=51316 RepID=U6G542_9EIME|nr:hypothetical protein, conserved [Eimeria praecox]
MVDDSPYPPTAPAPTVAVEEEPPSRSRLRQPKPRNRTQAAGYRSPADGPRLLEPPSPVAGRSSSHSSSRTRSLSVSPPVERSHHRAGRRLRALGEGSHGARTRSFSAKPARRFHYRTRTPQEGYHHDHALRIPDEQTALEPKRKGDTKE